MKTFHTMHDLLNSFPTGPPDGITFEIQSAFMKAWTYIHGYSNGSGKSGTLYHKIMVATSGGADSDIVIDLIERIGHPRSEVRYVFYETGLEFDATRRHLKYLEDRYGVKIDRIRAVTPIPLGVKKYGIPFLSKRASDYIHRLQKHGFQWEDGPFSELIQKYPRCQSALRWWCNEWGAGSQMNIQRHRWLREFMAEHPPDFPISDGCCTGAKKASARRFVQEFHPDLNIQGLRRAENGARAAVYKTCFDSVIGGPDLYRPIFWFRKGDKDAYDRVFGIVHSDCYTLYGLTRTGCACCPFGRDFEAELTAAKEYEPKLYAAAVNVFGKSYEYTRAYRAYARARDKEGGQ